MKNIISILIPLSILFSECSQRYPLDLGGGYKIEYDPNSYLGLVDKDNTIMVNSHITKFKFDSVFIVIEQKPVDLILKSEYNNPKCDLKKINELFEKSILRCYWIIKKTERREYYLDLISNTARYTNVHGPYTKQEYLQKLKEFKVPQKLALENK